jgi:hypothetical protein
MDSVYLTPSFYGHVANGILVFAAVIYLYCNYNTIKSVDYYKKLILIILFSIAIGIHSLSHLGLEYVYNYNPISNYFFNSTIS